MTDESGTNDDANVEKSSANDDAKGLSHTLRYGDNLLWMRLLMVHAMQLLRPRRWLR